MSKSNKEGFSRRDLLGTSLTAATVAGLAGSVGTLTLSGTPARADEDEEQAKITVRPGQLDEYYGFWSGGHSGEVRILGLPSMRELMRIPVFNRDSATGWGLTNESLKVLTEGLMPATKEYLASVGKRPTRAVTATIRAPPTPTGPMTAAMYSSTTRPTPASHASVST
jgi:nitrous-oxide reductase